MAPGVGEVVGDSSSDILVEVLGTVRLTIGGQPVAVPGGKVRTLLALLALSAGQPVPVPALGRALWGDTPPQNVRASLQAVVARLRKVINRDVIDYHHGGYRLRVEPDQVDLSCFRRLVAGSARTTDPAARRHTLAEALALWQGPPLTGVDSSTLDRQAAALTEEWLTALEQRIDLDLRLGSAAELVPELHELCARHPLREPLWSRLLTALYRAGRPAEAIESYHRLRATLADQLGTDPSPRSSSSTRNCSPTAPRRPPHPPHPPPWLTQRTRPPRQTQPSTYPGSYPPTSPTSPAARPSWPRSTTSSTAGTPPAPKPNPSSCPR